MDHRVIGVVPESEFRARPRLFRALGTAFDVTFVPREPDELDGLDGLVLLDGTSTPKWVRAARLPTLVAPASVPPHPETAAVVRVGRSVLVDPVLRGRDLTHRDISSLPALDVAPGEDALGIAPGGPVWTALAVGPVHRVALPLTELAPTDRLKDHLAPGSFLPLLALVHVLREAASVSAWTPPPLRAAFIIDDPNLHWPTYGYLRYPDLAAHAARHDYHVGVAMLPLDASFAHAGTVQVLRQRPQLSLLVHGNNHVKRELDRPSSEESLAVAAQALRRVAAFEHKHRVTVSRVMVPPHDDYLGAGETGAGANHGSCSEEMMRALFRTGFEAVCYQGPSSTGPAWPLAGWLPADVHLGGGLPGLQRVPFGCPTDELVLRAFLGQALILFGHHTDLRHNLDVLSQAADQVREVGAVEWRSLEDIARSSLSTRVDGDVLHVRSYSHHIRLGVPEGVGHLSVELLPRRDGIVSFVMSPGDGNGPAVHGAASEPVRVPPGASHVDIVFARPGAVDPDSVPAPAWRPWPVLRRCMTEGRDRLLPLVSRPRREGTPAGVHERR